MYFGYSLRNILYFQLKCVGKQSQSQQNCVQKHNKILCRNARFEVSGCYQKTVSEQRYENPCLIKLQASLLYLTGRILKTLLCLGGVAESPKCCIQTKCTKLHFRYTRRSTKHNSSVIAPSKSQAWPNVLEKGFLFESHLHVFEDTTRVNNANVPQSLLVSKKNY